MAASLRISLNNMENGDISSGRNVNHCSIIKLTTQGATVLPWVLISLANSSISVGGGVEMFVYVVFWLVDGSTRYRTASETAVWLLSSLMIGIQMMLEETVL